MTSIHELTSTTFIKDAQSIAHYVRTVWWLQFGHDSKFHMKKYILIEWKRYFTIHNATAISGATEIRFPKVSHFSEKINFIELKYCSYLMKVNILKFLEWIRVFLTYYVFVSFRCYVLSNFPFLKKSYYSPIWWLIWFEINFWVVSHAWSYVIYKPSKFQCNTLSETNFIRI